MSRCLLSVQVALDGDCSFLTDGELAFSIWSAINGIFHFALATLVWVCCLEGFQTLSYFCILIYWHLYIGALKLWFVVINISQLHHHPWVGNMVLVVVIVFTLKKSKIPLILITTIQYATGNCNKSEMDRQFRSQTSHWFSSHGRYS